MRERAVCAGTEGGMTGEHSASKLRGTGTAFTTRLWLLPLKDRMVVGSTVYSGQGRARQFPVG